MKNILILVIASLLVLNCSTNDRDSSSSIQINPPAWIQGTWMDESQVTGFKFTSNDIVTINFNAQQSQRELLELGADVGEEVSANDESTSDYYSVELNFPAGQTVIYSFNRLSDNQINWATVSGSVYTKQ
ncbi:hypothetical protein V8G56_02180 [Gaetbulibacter aquiaggeris]|uniref:Lipoprotein n=1 Tax=Gaetbulibacter aquiaggeris TaxID=1735373 RepID=A0ABW7ML31_9FLAO